MTKLTTILANLSEENINVLLPNQTSLIKGGTNRCGGKSGKNKGGGKSGKNKGGKSGKNGGNGGGNCGRCW